MKGFEEYRRWMNEPTLDGEMKKELESIFGNEKEIEERFYKQLDFGTAGLRGIMGAGTNRMNAPVIRRATLGLANYIKCFDGGDKQGVAIAYDSRRNSEDFALQAALTLCEKGIRVFLYESLRPVPMLSYTLRRLGCIAGIVITASHNPPKYNGYKVYWQDGGQVAPKDAEKIFSHIQNADYFEKISITKETAVNSGLLTYLCEKDDEAYYKDALSLLQRKDVVKTNGDKLKIVYTPLHGSGSIPVSKILNMAGLTNVFVVREQELPNGDFPTVKTPNPEDFNAFDMAISLAHKVDGDIIIATDPDCDRMGIAIRDNDGEFIPLSGNKTASIILYYMLLAMKERGELPSDAFVAKSVVSTDLADAICKHFGIKLKNTPTGFRFIAKLIEESKRYGEGSFIFGFEESYGCLAGGFARDKDAVLAAMLIGEAALYYKVQGKGLTDALDEMGSLFGWYDEAAKSYTLEGKAGIEKINKAMQAIRQKPFDEFNGAKVIEYKDFSSVADEGEKMNMVRFSLENGAWVCIRPSGTEPKLKLYIGAASKEKQNLKGELDGLYKDGDEKIKTLFNGEV